VGRRGSRRESRRQGGHRGGNEIGGLWVGGGGLVAPNGLVIGNDGVLGHLDFRFGIKDARLLKEQVVAYGECVSRLAEIQLKHDVMTNKSKVYQ